MHLESRSTAACLLSSGSSTGNSRTTLRRTNQTVGMLLNASRRDSESANHPTQIMPPVARAVLSMPSHVSHLPAVGARPQRLHERSDRQCGGAARVPVVGSQRGHEAARRRVRSWRPVNQQHASMHSDAIALSWRPPYLKSFKDEDKSSQVNLEKRFSDQNRE